MTILVVAEHDNASIKGATLNTITAAKAAQWLRTRLRPSARRLSNADRRTRLHSAGIPEPHVVTFWFLVCRD